MRSTGRWNTAGSSRWRVTTVDVCLTDALGAGHAHRIENLVELVLREQIGCEHHVLHAAPAFEGGARDLRGRLVADGRQERGDDPDRVVDEPPEPVLVRRDACDAPFAQ